MDSQFNPLKEEVRLRTIVMLNLIVAKVAVKHPKAQTLALTYTPLATDAGTRMSRSIRANQAGLLMAAVMAGILAARLKF